MSVSKVQFDGNDLINLERDTVTAAHLESGYTAHDASGAVITGSLTPGITPSGNKAIAATTAEQTGIDVTSYATVSVTPTPSETKSTTTNGTVTPTSGKLLSSVTVNVPTGTARSSSDLTVSGATVTAPAGLYASAASKSVASGSVTVGTPTINTSTGVVTGTATVSAGYVSGTPASKTLALSTQAAKTVTPSASAQTAVAANKYTTGAVTVAAVPTETKSMTLGSAAPSAVTPTSGKFLTSVSPSIDTSVIKAENIAQGATILGIAGTHSGGGATLQSKSVTYTSNGSATVTPDSGYDGLSSVDVTVNVSGGGGIPSPVSSTVIVSTDGSPGSATVYEYFYAVSHEPVYKQAHYITSGNLITLSNVGAFGIYSEYGDISINPSNNVARILYSTDVFNYYYTLGNCTVSVYIECFLSNTLISLADGTKKQIKDLTYSDILRVWDFDAGTYGTAGICWLTRSGMKNGHYYKLTFSDGTVLKTTGKNSNHKVYNVDERYFKGVNVTEIGDRIFSENGIVTVTNKEYIEEEVEYYNLITTQKIDCFAEGILTSDRYGNLYPIDDNMMYIKDGREIRPYSEFEAVGISRYWYDTLRLGEVTGTVEETRAYIDKLECQMLPLPEEENE